MTRLTIALFAAGALLFACSSDDSPASTASSPPSGGFGAQVKASDVNLPDIITKVSDEVTARYKAGNRIDTITTDGTTVLVKTRLGKDKGDGGSAQFICADTQYSAGGPVPVQVTSSDGTLIAKTLEPGNICTAQV